MKKLIFMMMPIFALSQTGGVGINTHTPESALDINGDLIVRNMEAVTESEFIVVSDAKGKIKKIPFSSFSAGVVCPEFLKAQSSPYYVIFRSLSSIPNPNNPVIINGLNFVSSGTRIENNFYYYTYSKTSGSELNVNNFSVNFGSKKCTYN